MKDYTLDSVTITPRQVTYVSGVDYMTDYDEWLHIQVSEEARISLFLLALR